MRSRPFFALLTASLFVALTLTAVGLGWGEHVEDLPVVTQSDGVALAPDSSVNDPEGDLLELRMLQPFPYPGRDVTIVGNTATVKVPTWLLGNPPLFNWAAVTWRLNPPAPLDLAPDVGFYLWAKGELSEVGDSYDLGLLPYQDLTYARVRDLVSPHIEFTWRCRGDIPLRAYDVMYWMSINRSDYLVVLGSTDLGWNSSVTAGPGRSFPWNSASYEDILGATVSQTGDGQLKFELRTAGTIPASPSTSEGDPWFSWVLDVDRDEASGGANDVNVVVRWDPESSAWEGAVRGWSGRYYEDLDTPVTVSISDSVVSATLDSADLGLVAGFLWQVRTTVNVGPAEEQLFGLADYAPDSGWVDEPLSPTVTRTPTAGPTSEPSPTPTLTVTPAGAQRIYLPIISRGVGF